VTVMLHDQKPPLDEALLAHHGIKGMHWGVRKDGESSGYRLQTSAPKFEPGFSPATKKAATDVAKLIGDRYDHHI
jgi:hypothetical protein